MNLPPLLQGFVLHFGEMGSRWGINRTVGQIYALLFLSDRPLHAEAITEALGVSRSNVSMGLKELQAWRLVRLTHIPDDRRDHFTTPEDVFEIVRILAEERRKREIDPTMSMLRDALMAPPHGAAEAHAHARMAEMLKLIELLTGWHDDVAKLPTDRLVALLKLGARVGKVLEFTGRVTTLPGRRRRNEKEPA